MTSAGLWVAAAVLFRTKYVHEAIAIFSAGNVIRPISRILLFRVHEVGELSLNLPSSKLGPLQPVAWIIGAVVVTLVLRYLRPSRLGSVEVYLAAYVGILCVWPYGDTRFWIPVLPLLFAEIFWLTQPWTWSGWRRTFVNWYAVGYFLAGLLALAYSTWLTFSAGAFPDRFGDSHLRPTYRAFYGYPNIDQSQIDQAALELLRRYSPRRHETIP